MSNIFRVKIYHGDLLVHEIVCDCGTSNRLLVENHFNRKYTGLRVRVDSIEVINIDLESEKIKENNIKQTERGTRIRSSKMLSSSELDRFTKIFDGIKREKDKMNSLISDIANRLSTNPLITNVFIDSYEWNKKIWNLDYAYFSEGLPVEMLMNGTIEEYLLSEINKKEIKTDDN
jgi:hypothetical protein